MTYEAIVLHCELDEDTPTSTGGDVIVALDGQDISVYGEEPGRYAARALEPKAPFKHKVAYCSPPLYGSVEVARITEWLHYHSHMGVDYFVVYDCGGVGYALHDALNPWIKAKKLEIVHVGDTSQFDMWYYGQVLLLNDCAYRLRYTAHWMLTMDFDEYLDADGPHKTLPALLRPYEAKPYVTFGSLWWSAEKCHRGGEDEWAIQRMLWHWPHVYCVNKEAYPRWELCLDYYGHRKFAADPRNVTTLQIHRPDNPATGGFDFDTTDAKINHYQARLTLLYCSTGIVKKNAEVCTMQLRKNEDIDWWVRDEKMAIAAEAIRKSI
eukprot:SM000044S15944  [mRNA]  locus=s44:95389:97481:- [translate_table: standard]